MLSIRHGRNALGDDQLSSGAGGIKTESSSELGRLKNLRRELVHLQLGEQILFSG